uniref:Uncharacterized protein n=1 Tax=Anopheles merus TaxID=30066 RepID=A0A182VA11_ANOME
MSWENTDLEFLDTASPYASGTCCQPLSPSFRPQLSVASAFRLLRLRSKSKNSMSASHLVASHGSTVFDSWYSARAPVRHDREQIRVRVVPFAHQPQQLVARVPIELQRAQLHLHRDDARQRIAYRGQRVAVVGRDARHRIGVQNCFSASHCRLMTGGVKCKKFGIFISSALANLPGDIWLRFVTYPCRIGSGTADGLNVRGPGHTAPQSWSVAICCELCYKPSSSRPPERAPSSCNRVDCNRMPTVCTERLHSSGQGPQARASKAISIPFRACVLKRCKRQPQLPLSNTCGSTFDSTSTLENSDSVSESLLLPISNVELAILPMPLESSDTFSLFLSAMSPDGDCGTFFFDKESIIAWLTTNRGTLRRWETGAVVVVAVILPIAFACFVGVRREMGGRDKMPPPAKLVVLNDIVRLTILGFLKMLRSVAVSSFALSPCSEHVSGSDSLPSFSFDRFIAPPAAPPTTESIVEPSSSSPSGGKSTASSEQSDRLAMSSRLLLLRSMSFRSCCWQSSSKKVTPRCRWFSFTSRFSLSYVTLSSRSMLRSSR